VRSGWSIFATRKSFRDQKASELLEARRVRYPASAYRTDCFDLSERIIKRKKRMRSFRAYGSRVSLFLLRLDYQDTLQGRPNSIKRARFVFQKAAKCKIVESSLSDHDPRVNTRGILCAV